MNQQNSKITLEQINKILIYNDPIGLIQGGAPEDEYNTESNQIMEILSKAYSVDSLAEDIYQIFVKSFGRDTVTSKDIYRVIAEELNRINT